MDSLHTALHDTFGFSAFRGVQEQVLRRVLDGRSTLAVMPTGAGKSLTYQLPAVMLPGTCVVISPLIALMHDQLRSAEANGIRAATLTSADADRAQTIERFRAGALDLLYVAPERASQGHFREMLGSEAWHGGFWNRTGGHINPLALARGLAQAVIEAGGRIFARTPALATKSPKPRRAPRTASVKSGGFVVPPSYIVRWSSAIPFSFSGTIGMPTPAENVISLAMLYSSPTTPQSLVQR